MIGLLIASAVIVTIILVLKASIWWIDNSETPTFMPDYEPEPSRDPQHITRIFWGETEIKIGGKHDAQ